CMARRILPTLLSTIVVTALAPSAALADGQVTLNPAAGAPGTSVVLRGSGFGAFQQVTVRMRSAATRSVTSSRTGAFLTRLTIPRGVSGSLTVVSRRGHMRVVNTFFVAPRADPSSVIEIASSRGGRVRATPARLVPGRTLALRGTGFGPGRRLGLTVFGARHRLTTRRNGVFTLVVPVPTTLRSGPTSAVLTGAGDAFRLRL